jgi:hypothetical protein
VYANPSKKSGRLPNTFEDTAADIAWLYASGGTGPKRLADGRLLRRGGTTASATAWLLDAVAVAHVYFKRSLVPDVPLVHYGDGQEFDLEFERFAASSDGPPWSLLQKVSAVQPRSSLAGPQFEPAFAISIFRTQPLGGYQKLGRYADRIGGAQLLRASPGGGMIAHFAALRSTHPSGLGRALGMRDSIYFGIERGQLQTSNGAVTFRDAVRHLRAMHTGSMRLPRYATSAAAALLDLKAETLSVAASGAEELAAMLQEEADYMDVLASHHTSSGVILIDTRCRGSLLPSVKMESKETESEPAERKPVRREPIKRKPVEREPMNGKRPVGCSGSQNASSSSSSGGATAGGGDCSYASDSSAEEEVPIRERLARAASRRTSHTTASSSFAAAAAATATATSTVVSDADFCPACNDETGFKWRCVRCNQAWCQGCLEQCLDKLPSRRSFVCLPRYELGCRHA